MDNQTIVVEGTNPSRPSAMARNLTAVQGNLDAIAKYVLYAIVALLPLWFLPSPVGIEFGREATFGILIVALGVLWLLAVLTSGSVRIQQSIFLWLGGALLLIWGASTAFSLSWQTSLIFSDAVSEKISTLLLGLLLMVAIGGVLRSKRDAAILLLTLVMAGGVSAFLTLIQLLTDSSVWGFFAEFAKQETFNVVGTLNGLSLFYSSLVGISVGMIVSMRLEDWKTWVRWALYLATILLFASTLIINYSYSWIVLIGVSIVLFGFTFHRVRGSQNAARALGGEERSGLDWRYLFAIILLVVSIFMYMFEPRVVALDLPAEVSPSMGTTWNIGKAVLAGGPQASLFGTGPATFGLDWLSYKDPQVNQTAFWGVRFNQGFSWISTLLPTVGILGAIGMILFFGASLFTFARAAAAKRGEGHADWASLGVGPLVGFVALVIAAFLYPANFTLVILLFGLAGILSFILSEKEGMAEVSPRGGFMNSVLFTFSERRVRFDSQWAVFLSSLVVIFLLALGIAGVYFELNRVRAAVAAEAGVTAFGEQKYDDAVTKLEEAIALEPQNVNYANALAQAHIQRVSALIQRAARGELVQGEFQQEFNRANDVLQGAIDTLPIEPNLWRSRGALYELTIPVIPGTETYALDSYRKAIEVSPLNPAPYVDFGRAGLTFADNAQLRIPQANVGDREQIAQAREKVLKEVQVVLEKGIQVKPDFAAAHFLLSQTAIRLGDLQNAIRATENAKATAPFDIGVAFQLGLLYYQSGNLDLAQGEFERAVSINENYSNARYFLGLIYDRKGRKEDAIAQFVKIEALNSDNQEVKSILTNLRADPPRAALENIVPPGTPPEDRKEPPVEGGEN